MPRYLESLKIRMANHSFSRLIAALLVALPFCLHAQSGTISGRVYSSDHKPVESVNVMLDGTTLGDITNQEGDYVIKGIKPGTYQLQASFVGLITQSRTVTLAGEERVVVDFTMAENEQQLKEIVVTGNRSQNKVPVMIGKMPIKPMDLPQAVATIDAAVMEQQQTIRLGEVLQNVNGVYVMGTTGGYQEEIAGRGFAFGSDNTFKNGIRFNNGIMPEASSLASLEVLKGSAAILYGNVAPGGVLNLITKKPMFTQGGEVSFRAGSFRFYKPTIDVYGAINNTDWAAYRMNVSYENAGSFRDDVRSERIYANPSLLFMLTKKTSLILEGDYLKDDRVIDYGTGAIDYKVADVPRERFLGTPWQYFAGEQGSLTATLSHKLSDGWAINAIFGGQRFSNDLFSTTRPNAGNFVQPDGTWRRNIQRTETLQSYGSGQVNLTGQFSTAGIGHQLLIGAEADQYKTQNLRYNNLNGYDTINILDPSLRTPRTDIPELTKLSLTDNPVSRQGFYIQDLISLGNHFKVLAGLRYSIISSSSNVLTYKDTKLDESQSTDDALTPKVGLVYQPTKTTSLFVSYSNNFALNSGVDINGKVLPPSTIHQYEAGIKNEIMKGLLTANLTAYQIVNSNLAQQSLVNGNTYTYVKELAGEVTSKGIEADLRSKPWHGLSAIAGYSFNDTRYTKSNTYEVGSLLRYNPAHTANLSIFYAVPRGMKLEGLNAGLTAFYFGERQAGRSTRLNVENDLFRLIPLTPYALLNATVGYRWQRAAISLKAANITDVLNYNAHDDNSINPIAPRNYSATVSYKF